MGNVITTRVPDEIARDIAFFTKLEKLDRSTLTRKLLAEAIEEHKIDYALRRYKNKEISLWKSARIANIPLSRMLSILRQKGIPFNYSEKNLEDDIKSADKYAKR